MNLRTLWLCNGCMMCIALGTSCIPVFLTTFAEAFGGLNEQQLGRISSSLFAGTFLGIMASAPLADRVNGKVFVLTGLGLSFVGLWGLAAAPSYATLLFAAAGMGLGAGVLDMILSPIVAAVASERRVSAMNQLHAFYCIGVVTIVGFASVSVALGLNWRTAVICLSAGPTLLFLAFLSQRVPPLVEDRANHHGMRKLLRLPRFWAALLLIACIGATEEGMAQWLPAYAERELGFARVSGGLALAAFAVIMAVTRLLAPIADRRIGGHGLLITSGLGSGLFFVLGAVLHNPWLALVACMMVGFCCSALWPTHLGVTADRLPMGGPSMFALIAAFGNLGNIVAPYMQGSVAARTDLSTALLVASAFPFAVGLLSIGVLVWDRRTLDKRRGVGAV